MEGRISSTIDHTLLKPTATKDYIVRLCKEAEEYGFASVCVSPAYVSLASDLLKGKKVKVCTVVGFPLGFSKPEVKLLEAMKAIEDGAQEIDMVINIGALKSGDYDLVKKEIESIIRLAKERGVITKVIIETCYLTDDEKVKACLIAKEAGADFVKTCYDKDTEVLTKRGWKFFKDVTLSDEIATLNPETFYLEYQRPIQIIKQRYKGEMIKIRLGRNNTELIVTPNHQIYYASVNYYKYRRKRSESKLFKFKSARDLSLFNRIIVAKRDSYWTGEDKDAFLLPGCRYDHKHYDPKEKSSKESPYESEPKRIPMDYWLKFLGWYISKGSTGHRMNAKRKKYYVCISQKSEENTKDICEIARSIGFSPTIFYDKKRGEYRMIIHSKQLYEYLKQFGNCYQRFIPAEVKNLAPEKLKILLTYLCKGNGHFVNGHISEYLTASKRLADDIQEIALKANYIASIQTVSPKGGKRQENPCYNVIFSIGKVRNISNRCSRPRYEKVYYDDYVYCVEVPNHIIYVRWNGKPLWCGNSTGWGTSGATVEDVRLIRKVVGDEMGIKASGGIRTLKDALAMIEAGATRIGTSTGVAIAREEMEQVKSVKSKR